MGDPDDGNSSFVARSKFSREPFAQRVLVSNVVGSEECGRSSTPPVSKRTNEDDWTACGGPTPKTNIFTLNFSGLHTTDHDSADLDIPSSRSAHTHYLYVSRHLCVKENQSMPTDHDQRQCWQASHRSAEHRPINHGLRQGDKRLKVRPRPHINKNCQCLFQKEPSGRKKKHCSDTSCATEETRQRLAFGREHSPQANAEMHLHPIIRTSSGSVRECLCRVFWPTSQRGQ